MFDRQRQIAEPGVILFGKCDWRRGMLVHRGVLPGNDDALRRPGAPSRDRRLAIGDERK
jgi:hypothetical protein